MDFVTPNYLGEPLETDPECEECDDEGCIYCDKEIAAEYAADMQYQAQKERDWDN